MSRSGYTDGCDGDNWSYIRWRGAVKSAMNGSRGKAFLRELLAAMDAMPSKRLIAEDLEVGGEVCALGSVGKARGLDMSKIDSDDRESVANLFGITLTLACEIMYMNDDYFWKDETPEFRFARMRQWLVEKIGEGR